MCAYVYARALNCMKICMSASEATVLPNVPALSEFVLVLHGVLSVFGSVLFILGLQGLIKKVNVCLFNGPSDLKQQYLD